MSVSNTEGLKALAANVDRNHYPHVKVDPELLERAEFRPLGANGNIHADPIVTLDCPEFTSLCPLTGQPDFGALTIIYQPEGWIVESKSLKLFIGSFRNSGEFHEACVGMITAALVSLIQPKWLAVKGVFRPRGGIAINPTGYAGPVPDWVFLKG